MQDIYKKIINKPTVDEIYYNFFTKYVSACLTKIIYKTPLTPNFVSYIMLVFGIGAIYFLSLNDSVSLLFSGVLFIIHNILDTVDGDLARAKNQTSPFGKFIDQITHSIINPSIFFALFFRYQDQSDYSIIFIICGFVFLIDMYLKKNFEILTNNKYSFSIKKKNKNSHSLLKIREIKFINDIFFSIIGFYHLLIIILLIDLFILENFSLIYFYLFSTVVIIKFLLRLVMMSKILINLK